VVEADAQLWIGAEKNISGMHSASAVFAKIVRAEGDRQAQRSCDSAERFASALFCRAQNDRLKGLLQHENILAGTNVLQNFRPDAHRHLAQMSFSQQQHQGARLSHAAADAEWN